MIESLCMDCWYTSAAAKIIASRKQSLGVVLKHVGPTIVERRRNMELYGKDWAERPVRLLVNTMHYMDS